MEARAGRLTDRRESLHGGASVHGRLHAAATVVRGRHDWDEVLRHVDAELKALVEDVGEALLEEGASLAPDVEAAVGIARALHLTVDRARHDVARRERPARVVLLHERLPLAVHEHGPLPAHGLADEEPLRLRVVEARGVELDELHVLHLRAGAPGKRHAVARRHVGVAGVEVHLAAAARREDRVGGADGVDLLRLAVEHVRAHAAVGPLHADALRDDEVDHDRVLVHLDLGMALHRAHHRGLALLARDVARVEDAAHRVPALAAEVPASVLLLREPHAAVDQVADARRRLRHDLPHHVLVAEARARDLRVAHVLLERVGGVRHAADSPLREVGVAVLEALLRDEHGASGGREVQRAHESAHAGADDEIVTVDDSHGFLAFESLSPHPRRLMSAPSAASSFSTDS